MALPSPDSGSPFRHLYFGITIALAVSLMTFAGARLDKALGTDPVFTLLMALWGVAASFFWIWIRMKRGL